MKLSVIIPVFNEASTIREVLEKVRQVNLDKEIIVINDGSTDETGEILEKEKAEDPITVVHNSLINIGKGAGVRIGLEYARGDVVIIQDADLEMDPNEYPLLLDPIERGETQVVYGSRFLNSPPWELLLKWGIRYAANWFLTALTNLLFGSRLTDMETAYKAIRLDVLRKIRFESHGFEIEPEITAKLLRLGYSIKEVPITYHPRTIEEGKKMRTLDGFHAILHLIRYRLQKRKDLIKKSGSQCRKTLSNKKTS